MLKIILISLFTLPCFSNEKSESQLLKAKFYQELTKNHHPITYKQANEILFTKIDNHSGMVCSVYSKAFCLTTDSVPSPKLMNIEHTWPQSDGANGDAKSDLHHIFPVESSVNSIRSSLPFCDVVDVKWTKDLSKRGFSQFNEHCFEPPPEHKGNVARALFYFSIRYQKPIDQNQEYFLRKWNKEDPIDQAEIDRNLAIKTYENITNPFIDDPTLADKISDF